MATYTLTVELDPKWRRRWEKVPEMRLCFATSVATGMKSYGNVVAATANIAPVVKITWKESYKIAATDTEFSHGAQFDASSDRVDAYLGSVTTVSKNWDIDSEISDEAPEASFVYRTKRSTAAILYKHVQGGYKPVYVSHAGSLPPHSTETLTPKLKVYVWFSSEFEDSTMIDSMSVQRKEIDMTGRLSASIRYNADGNWVQPPPVSSDD